MLTSCFSQWKRIEPGMKPVAISRGKPAWYKAAAYLPLAPTWPMLKLPRPQFCEAYGEQLRRLDPREVARDLGENAVLLCWEPPNVFCHRRIVAEWLETELGLVIPELGFPREAIRPSAEMPDKQPTKPKEKRRKGRDDQGLLGFM